MKSNAVTIKIDKYDGMLEPAAKAWYYERLAEAAYSLVTGNVSKTPAHCRAWENA